MNKNNRIDGPSAGEQWYYRSGPLMAGLLITALALIIYLPALKAPFVLDDEVNIVKNLRLHEFSNFWPPAGSRYLAYLSFALNYAMGGLHTTGYHLVNLVIHILTAMTLYGLVRSIFRTPAMMSADKGGQGHGLANHIALITALIFTAHPLNTQAVIYITQRLTIMASLFYLLSLYLYIKWRIKGPGGLSVIFYILSIITAIAAEKTKEISFTLPFVILLTEYVFFTEPGRWITRRRLYALIPYALILIIIPLSIFGPELGLWSGRAIVDEGFTRVQQILDIKELSSYTYLMTEFTVVPRYIRLFFLPVGQNLDYDYPLYHSFFNPQVLGGFCLLLFVFASSLLTAVFARKSKKPLLLISSAGILWFFITLSVESTVIPIRDVIFEHRMYLPGAGLSVAVAVLIVYFLSLRKKSVPGKSVLITSLILGLLLTIPALGRSLVWSDKARLYEDMAEKSPGKARVRNNLGVLYAKRGEFKKAIAEFKKALTLKSDYPAPHKNLAKALFAEGETSEAMSQYIAAIRADPLDYEAHEALAGIYRDEGLFAKSEKEYKMVLSLLNTNINARLNLANIYIVRGRFEEAITELRKILKKEPGKAEAYYNLALALEKTGRAGEALYYYKKFAKKAPSSMSEYRQRALIRIEALGRKER